MTVLTEDRELLEQAAKAAGIEGHYREYVSDETTLFTFFVGLKPWNPLTDDGHALRLAVKLNLLIDCCGRCARPLPDSIGWQDGNSTDDPCAATRRAIVRAAAEIGKATK